MRQSSVGLGGLGGEGLDPERGHMASGHGDPLRSGGGGEERALR